MELHNLIRFARTYSALGWSIQEQLDDILDDNFEDLNPNALKEINNTLKGYNDDLDDAIEKALEAQR